MRIFKAVLAIVIAVQAGIAGQSTPLVPPLIAVYTAGESLVEMVTVSVTNPNKDMGIMIASVEFTGQLPETRYFYHGIFGCIAERGDADHYYLVTMIPSLTIPLGSCFLLPGQSSCWKRPMRVLSKGYDAEVTWVAVAKDEIATSVWYYSHADEDIYGAKFPPLLETSESLYSNVAAAKGRPKILAPVRKQELSLSVACIDSNSLGKELILAIGVEFDAQGKVISKEQPSEPAGAAPPPVHPIEH
ncbi:MAG: hypothetical protein ABIF71_13105 [Planctomycetota bacterium]